MSRFLDRYERREHKRRAGETRRGARPLRITVGVMLVIIAVLIGWLPGPGFIPLFLAGSFLLASEFRVVAVVLDWGEHRGRHELRKRFRRGKHTAGETDVEQGSTESDGPAISGFEPAPATPGRTPPESE